MSLLCLTIFLSTFVNSQGSSGVIQLDSVSFPKIVDGSHNIIIKFGETNPYGESGEEWESLGIEVADKPEIIMAEVNLNTGSYEDEYDYYGGMSDGMSDDYDNGNEQLFEQYNITPENTPAYRLFLKNSNPSKPKQYNNKDNLLQWIQSNGIYLGLEGQIKEFDELIPDFVGNQNDQNKRDDIGKTAKQYLDEYDENSNKYKSGKYYIKVMAKIINNNVEWVNKESDRLNGILTSGNLSKDKQKWFQHRINILGVFRGVVNEKNKDEL